MGEWVLLALGGGATGLLAGLRGVQLRRACRRDMRLLDGAHARDLAELLNNPPHVHAWSVWTDVTGQVDVQHRSCTTCGLRELNRLAPDAGEHVHVWGRWTNCGITVDGHSRYGQERYCDGCGVRETRLVKSGELA